MTLKLQLQLVVKERKVAIIMRIPNPDMNITLRNSQQSLYSSSGSYKQSV